MGKTPEMEDAEQEEPFVIKKGAEYRPPPDWDDNPPPPMPRSDQEDNEED